MQNIFVPTIYYWEEFYNGKPTVMTAAFQFHGQNYGMSFPIEENFVRKEMDKKHLLNRVRDTLDVLVHHGKNALDSTGNVHPGKVNDEEAARFWLDKLWRNRIVAFRKAVLTKEITREKAVALKLLD